MAKLEGNDILSFLGNISVYKVNGNTYVRSKSSLSRKRVLKSKAYARTRAFASHMARASKIGSEIYRGLKSIKRDRSFYQAITGEVASRLYMGEDELEVKKVVWEKYERNT